MESAVAVGFGYGGDGWGEWDAEGRGGRGGGDGFGGGVGSLMVYWSVWSAVGLIGMLVWIGLRDEGSRWVKSSRHSGNPERFCTGSTSRMGGDEGLQAFVAWLRCRLFGRPSPTWTSAASFMLARKQRMWVGESTLLELGSQPYPTSALA